MQIFSRAIFLLCWMFWLRVFVQCWYVTSDFVLQNAIAQELDRTKHALESLQREMVGPNLCNTWFDRRIFVLVDFSDFYWMNVWSLFEVQSELEDFILSVCVCSAVVAGSNPALFRIKALWARKATGSRLLPSTFLEKTLESFLCFLFCYIRKRVWSAVYSLNLSLSVPAKYTDLKGNLS